MVDFEMVYSHSKTFNVLYVESDKDIRTSTEEILKKYFLSLDIAIDGQDALLKYNKFHTDNRKYYDVVISELEIPHINGVELSDTILDIYSEQTIIILSAYTDPMYLFELINLGISSFISKPIKLHQLNRVFYRAFRTISKRKLANERRVNEKIERKYLMGVIDLQDNIIVITDGQKIQSANQSLLNFFDFKSLEDFKQVNKCICYKFINDEEHFHLGQIEKDELWIEHMLQHPAQDFTVMMQNTKTLHKESFKVTVNYFHGTGKYIATFSNISKIALKNKVDKYKAIHDNLTGVYNRNKLNDITQNLFSTIKEQSYAFVLFDIDHFKKVNDIYGHLVGDDVLKQLTSIIKTNIRGSDIFVRWGGDEFILILEGIDSSEKAIKVTEQLCHNIDQSIFDKVGKLTCSFGVSLYRKGDMLNQMIERVDKALYDAKAGGRNQVVYAKD